MGRYSTNLLSRIRAGEVPKGLFEFDLGGTTYRFSDAPIGSLSQGPYLDRIIGWDDITWASSDRGFRSEYPTSGVRLSDPNRTITKLFHGEQSLNVRGATARIYLALDDLAFADWFLAFEGIIASKSTPDALQVQINLRLEDTSLKGVGFLPDVNVEDFPTADDASRSRTIPAIYGEHASASLGIAGMITATHCSTDGDADDKTTWPYRWVCSYGWIKDITRVWEDETENTNQGTDWEVVYSTRNGRKYTEIGFAADPGSSTKVTFDAQGLCRTVETSPTDLITNPAEQIEHALTNFWFNDWQTGGVWFDAATATPLWTEAIDEAEAFFNRKKIKGSREVHRQVGETLLNEWCFSEQVGTVWEPPGKLGLKVNDPHTTDIYLDDNDIAQWPWFESNIHGIGGKPIYPLAEDDQKLIDRINAQALYSSHTGKYKRTLVVIDPDRGWNSPEDMDLPWTEAKV